MNLLRKCAAFIFKKRLTPQDNTQIAEINALIENLTDLVLSINDRFYAEFQQYSEQLNSNVAKTNTAIARLKASIQENSALRQKIERLLSRIASEFGLDEHRELLQIPQTPKTNEAPSLVRRIETEQASLYNEFIEFVESDQKKLLCLLNRLLYNSNYAQTLNHPERASRKARADLINILLETQHQLKDLLGDLLDDLNRKDLDDLNRNYIEATYHRISARLLGSGAAATRIQQNLEPERSCLLKTCIDAEKLPHQLIQEEEQREQEPSKADRHTVVTWAALLGNDARSVSSGPSSAYGFPFLGVSAEAVAAQLSALQSRYTR